MIRVLIEDCPNGPNHPGKVSGAVAISEDAEHGYSVNFLLSMSNLGSLENNIWEEVFVPVQPGESRYDLLSRALTEFLKNRPTKGEKP